MHERQTVNATESDVIKQIAKTISYLSPILAIPAILVVFWAVIFLAIEIYICPGLPWPIWPLHNICSQPKQLPQTLSYVTNTGIIQRNAILDFSSNFIEASHSTVVVDTMTFIDDLILETNFSKLELRNQLQDQLHTIRHTIEDTKYPMGLLHFRTQKFFSYLKAANKRIIKDIKQLDEAHNEHLSGIIHRRTDNLRIQTCKKVDNLLGLINDTITKYARV
jgi:hypothetical protein